MTALKKGKKKKMELIYNEDIEDAVHRLVTVVEWPRVRVSEPGDLAILQVTDCGAEKTNWTLQAKVPFGITQALLATRAKVGELLELAYNGRLRYYTAWKERAVAQALQNGHIGDLIKVYWL